MCSALDSWIVGEKSEKKKYQRLGYCSSQGKKNNKTCRIAQGIFNGLTKLFCLCETSLSG